MENPPQVQLSAWKQVDGELDFEAVDRWFVGDHLNRYPLDRPISAADVLQGWRPESKLIDSGSKVLAFGSCFAEYFIKFLTQHGYNDWQLPPEKHGLSPESLLLSLGQTFENIFVIEQQVRWAFGEFTPQSALWFTKDKAYFEATEERRKNIRSSFEQADVIIITLGLSEVWWDRVAGEPMWRPITAKLYDPDRHVFKKATVGQTVTALGELHRLIETYLPAKKFVFTLSPIPLLATFRDQSAITANQVSKAVLRAALDEFFSSETIRGNQRYHYFPSYELAFHLFGSPFAVDNRHVRPEVAQTILNIFSELYTDLPVQSAIAEIAAPDNILERKIAALENELVAKERVIRQLDAAASERLEIIQRMGGRP